MSRMVTLRFLYFILSLFQRVYSHMPRAQEHTASESHLEQRNALRSVGLPFSIQTSIGMSPFCSRIDMAHSNTSE